MPEISWPTSTAPGVNPTETGGRLINAYAEAAPPGSRSKVIWRRAPGLLHAFSTIEDEARGSLLVGSVLYIISGNKAYSVTSSYVVSELTGTIGGTGPVTMARNMAAVPDILIVHSAGMSEIDISGSSIADFSDGDLPAVNSICWIDGYFIVTTASGQAYQSGVNDTSFSSVDRTTAEADPDGLYRAVALGSDLLLMGLASIEFYGNAGNPTGFAFSRGPVIPVGLKGPWAVAGFETGFSDNLIYVANDNTVRKQEGYTPNRISTPELERLIEAVTDVTTLEASVFVTAGHAFWVLSSPDWTWVYDVSTGNWHERQSYGESLWRGRFGVNAWDKWFCFDRDSEKVFQIKATVKLEDDQPLIWGLRSTQASQFPGRTFVKRASFDFVVGVGLDAGIDPIESNPVVRVRWSDDGGYNWGQWLTRSLGTQGQQVPIDIFRAGVCGRQGRMWELSISDPVEIAFFGGAMDLEARAA